jgi:hypothetical protein
METHLPTPWSLASATWSLASVSSRPGGAVTRGVWPRRAVVRGAWQPGGSFGGRGDLRRRWGQAATTSSRGDGTQGWSSRTDSQGDGASGGGAPAARWTRGAADVLRVGGGRGRGGPSSRRRQTTDRGVRQGTATTDRGERRSCRSGRSQERQGTGWAGGVTDGKQHTEERCRGR